LQDIVDAVFICYAMDKDMQSVTKPQVHEVFAQVPPCSQHLLHRSALTLMSFTKI
jgi:hypothetical protein